MNQSSVRRNLFHGNLSRRPASAGPPNGAVPPNPNGNGVSNRPSHRLKPTSSDSGPPPRPYKTVENKDIVVREKNGGYKLDVPALSPALIEDADDLAEHEEEGAFDATELTGIDKERFEAALVDMMIRHRNSQANDGPDEILRIVHESLRKKAASLDDDNWMFEPERDSFSN